MADPLQCLDLVQQSEVSRCALALKHFLCCQKTEHAEAITHIDADDAVLRIALAAVILIPGLPGLERTAMNIDGHRRLLQCSGRFPDVEIKTVLRKGLPIVVL